MPLARRRFLRDTAAALGGAAVASALGAARRSGPTEGEHTIGQVLDALRGLVPSDLPGDTVDTVKVGDPTRVCTGVVSTFLATVPVIEATAQRGANLLVTHEPTFYNHLDETAPLADDPVYAAKVALLERHGIAVFRFHDGYHRMAPDPMFRGFVRRMSWEPYAAASEVEEAALLPTATPLRVLAQAVGRQLGGGRVEYVGAADYPCRSVGILPGAWGRERQIGFLRSGQIDVLVVGESAEWEAVEYARDAQALGLGRALIVVGHAVSEDPGMVDLVGALRPLLPGIDVTHVAAGDPLSRV